MEQIQGYIMFSLIGICLILMFFSFLTDSMSKRRKRLLFFMALASTILLLSDWLAALYNGDLSTAGIYIARTSKFLEYSMNPLIVYIFSRYLGDLLIVEGRLPAEPKGLKVAKNILMIGAVLLVLSPFTGMYYTFDENNIYRRSPGYAISYIFPIVAVIILLAVTIRYRRNLRGRLLVPLLAFTAMPIASAIFHLVVLRISFTNIFIVAMVVLLYCFSILDANELVRTAHQKEINALLEKQKSVDLLVRQTTFALVEAIDAKDSYTNGHSRRVADFSVMIAEKAGKSREECEKIHLTALLHDIGKIGIPDNIINKEGKLTDEEYAIIKTHPKVGRDILSKISSSPELAIGASFHHERYDGRGYPFGLKGEEIPETARIIAVADTYDAMASKRSYRDVLPMEKIRSELEKGVGTQFDPQFAKIMLELIDSGKISRESDTAIPS